MTINHPGATSQKNAIISRSPPGECIDLTLGAEHGTNLDIGDFAEQAGLEDPWRPITLTPRSMTTITGNGSASGVRESSQSGTSSLALDIL